MANLNIVYLDEYSMGGRDVTPLRRLGNYTGYERTAPEQTCERCAEADVVITNKVVFDAATLDRLPRLRLICVAATGKLRPVSPVHSFRSQKGPLFGADLSLCCSAA